MLFNTARCYADLAKCKVDVLTEADVDQWQHNLMP